MIFSSQEYLIIVKATQNLSLSSRRVQMYLYRNQVYPEDDHKLNIAQNSSKTSLTSDHKILAPKIHIKLPKNHF